MISVINYLKYFFFYFFFVLLLFIDTFFDNSEIHSNGILQKFIDPMGDFNSFFNYYYYYKLVLINSIDLGYLKSINCYIYKKN